MAELEESRRKLVALQMQKHGSFMINASIASALTGTNSSDKPADKAMGLHELKESVEEAKTLAESHLFELQEAQEDNLILSKQLEALQMDRDHLLQREKELSAKAESADAAKNSINDYEGRIEELELQIQKLVPERNDLEIKLEEAMQDSDAIFLFSQSVLYCLVKSLCFRQKGCQR